MGRASAGRKGPTTATDATADALADALADARAVGLRYVNGTDPGISRHRRGRGFAYRDEDGRPMRDTAKLARIRSLAVPPAWINVWICPSARGHIQATGRDARGRKQYRYHALWRQVRDEAKFERSIAFAEALPALRRRVGADLRRPGLPKAKVVAAIIQLLETTLLRVGNEEYARGNRSYGLTTLRDRHAKVRGGALSLSFAGKSGKRHEVGLRDGRLARIVARCQDLPGQRLFQYLDDDERPQAVDSEDVNTYLRDATGREFSAKDFRTWSASVLAVEALREESGDGDESLQSRLVRAVVCVARDLGNTPAVCRRSYIHPAVIDAFLDGSLADVVQRRTGRGAHKGSSALRAAEQRTLALLRHRLAAARLAGQTSAA